VKPISSPSSKIIRGLVLGPLVSFFFLTACTVSSENIEYSRAEDAQKKNDFPGALKHYKALVEKYVKTPLAIKAAKEAAKINHYQLKQPKEAIVYYKHIVLYSPSPEDRLDAQKKIADLHFTQTLDYSQAIIEYSRLIDLPHNSQEDFAYRLAIARCYFYLSNFYQAQVEIDSILGRNYEKDMLFDAILLKANIFLTTKKLDDAIATLRQLMEKYPERSKTETIGLVLAVVYEEQKNFAKAIETLESIKDTYPKKQFIEQRIKVLKERQSYLPGARGFRK
jgi:tetratricopeptide (TPR) repeat protein